MWVCVNVQQVAAHFLLTVLWHWCSVFLVGLLTEKEVEQVWKGQGLEGHVGRMYDYLVQFGLQPMAVQRHTFLSNFRKRILTNFFVRGAEEDEHGRRTFPAD